MVPVHRGWGYRPTAAGVTTATPAPIHTTPAHASGTGAWVGACAAAVSSSGHTPCHGSTHGGHQPPGVVQEEEVVRRQRPCSLRVVWDVIVLPLHPEDEAQRHEEGKGRTTAGHTHGCGHRNRHHRRVAIATTRAPPVHHPTPLAPPLLVHCRAKRHATLQRCYQRQHRRTQVHHELDAVGRRRRQCQPQGDCAVQPHNHDRHEVRAGGGHCSVATTAAAAAAAAAVVVVEATHSHAQPHWQRCRGDRRVVRRAAVQHACCIATSVQRLC